MICINILWGMYRRVDKRINYSFTKLDLNLSLLSGVVSLTYLL